ncbi:NAD(P)/FAD-dependent oxidoreductase [Arthrobacter bambusae]|uniref:NAD(P)/FAD-dependent oxidoreductase n=1 Tax=Arthrobacter bambusae TaxID=1338426 RepID=UPI00278659EF|nr:FAD-dependent oxidoreductase [Arthrobacter bambusae]MDQ0030234.1 NADPH-dependent 2,4-dienoyl-CoA reductase/sulfur reductase-like enzyme [Arthrobacter bambusae]MDQ0097916.1 NADPH-dependent 2,4-dienoyl-CoA reductase/sulfur reductase-like enzyme [Arthrobacter bambusae]
MDTEHILIAGGGLAGATAAKTLRSEGFQGRITVVCAENEQPYLRPPLSKEFLLGKAGEDSVPVLAAGWYQENGVELLLGETVATADPGAHTVQLGSGTELQFSKLLIATGAQPRRLPLPGSDLAGVTTFRTFNDSRRLKEELARGGRNVVMIGSGWIGMELAAAASIYGNSVTLLGLEDVPLSMAIGPELGAFFRSVHEKHGVQFRLPASAAEITGTGNKASAVVTNSGEVLPADLVVMAVGVAPDTALAEAAGLEIGNGILVDSSLRSSSPDVFAAGDVANALHPFTGDHHRSEHWSNALNGGKVAAKAMLGQDAMLDVVPYFYTDQFDVSMEYWGYPTLAAGSAPVIRGSLAENTFLAFWLRDGAVVAGMSVNQQRVQKPVKALISGRVPVDVDRLTDPAVPIDQLLPN